jgi:hypothetical protein
MAWFSLIVCTLLEIKTAAEMIHNEGRESTPLAGDSAAKRREPSPEQLQEHVRRLRELIRHVDEYLSCGRPRLRDRSQ